LNKETLQPDEASEPIDRAGKKNYPCYIHAIFWPDWFRKEPKENTSHSVASDVLLAVLQTNTLIFTLYCNQNKLYPHHTLTHATNTVPNI
jgi:hypothetical protein